MHLSVRRTLNFIFLVVSSALFFSCSPFGTNSNIFVNPLNGNFLSYTFNNLEFDVTKNKVTAKNVLAGTISDFGLVNQSQTLTCSPVGDIAPAVYYIESYRMHIDLGPKQNDGSLNFNCQTGSQDFEFEIQYKANLLQMVTSNLFSLAYSISDLDYFNSLSALSNDSKKVAFTAGNQIYLKNLVTQTYTLINSPDGSIANSGDGTNILPLFSPDGNKVSFTSNAENLIAGVSGTQVYIKDLITNSITLVSSLDGTASTQGNGLAYFGEFSPDNKKVAMATTSTNLVAGTSGAQIIVKDLESNTFRLISSTDGTVLNQGDGLSTWPQFSADGKKIVFQSFATNLVSGTTSGSQIFVKNLETEEITLVSSTDGTAVNCADHDSEYPQINADGTKVLFRSFATNLVPGVSNTQIYIKNLQTQQITLVSSTDGTALGAGNDESTIASFSADGKLVTFHSLATNLIPGISTSKGRIFVKNLDTQQISLVSSIDGSLTNEADDDSEMALISRDGKKVFFSSFATNFGVNIASRNIYEKDLTTQKLTLINSHQGRSQSEQNGSTDRAKPSGDGQSVVFESSADNLILGTSGTQIYLKNLITQRLHLVSSIDGTAQNQANSGDASRAKVNFDGTKVVFETSATNLVPGANGTQIYLKDINAQQIQLVSSIDGTASTKANSAALNGDISRDANFVAFQSNATNLITGVSGTQVYIKNINTQSLSLVSSTDGTSATQANFSAVQPNLSANGQKVIFTSSATNLIAGVSNTQVFLKDLNTGIISLASSLDGTALTQANSSVWDAKISADGTKVFFITNATNLVAGASGEQLYQKNLITGEIKLVSSRDGTVLNQSDGGIHSPSSSADGQIISFYSTDATNLVSGAGGYQIYVKNMNTQDLQLVSSKDSTAQNQANFYAYSPYINDDGDKVVFTSGGSSNLIHGIGSNQIFLKKVIWP